MLVCRDLEKARKEFGFYFYNGDIPHLEKQIDKRMQCRIYCENGEISFRAWDSWSENINLDFLYDMIKDGILEKVEE